ncbi:MAG TPA: phosphoribosylanthranilate isomerase [Candidatus Omnitrophota bacterium]|nr:phosphoribosylanthranilate isomerase [Candidatus Omnitrophota bacterium]
MATLIKICGITNKIDALNACALDVDMLGFVFYEKSLRYVEPSTAEDIINELPESVGKVGVFVDEDESRVIKIAEDAGLSVLQFHGDETPEYCAKFSGKFKTIKAFRLKKREDLKRVNDYGVDYYLFDTFSKECAGGTGKTFDWKLLKDFEILKPAIISGGLDNSNVCGLLKELAPFGVDISTGVEDSPGRKNMELMQKFVRNVRGCQ